MIVSANELIDRLEKAMAEHGFPEVSFTDDQFVLPNGYPSVSTVNLNVFDQQALAAVWQATWMAMDGNVSCWSCFTSATGLQCVVGDCAHPEGPARPPRELLRRAS